MLGAFQLQAVVDNYKTANLTIARTCKQLSETLLVRIDGKKTYENLEFEQDQQKHRDGTQNRLHEMHRQIVSTMKTTYEVFRTDGNEVRQYFQWTEP